MDSGRNVGTSLTVTREIHNLDPQPHRYCMLTSTACTPRLRGGAWGCGGHVICAVSMQQRDWLADWLVGNTGENARYAKTP